jgi:DNA-binding beta-propeller fold protein YncE
MFCIVALPAVVLAAGQVGSVGIKPANTAAAPRVSSTQEKRVALAGPPVLGYVLGATATEVHPLFATAKAPKLGDALVVPSDSVRLFLPPRQQYALLEQSSGQALALWAMHKSVISGTNQEPLAIAGSLGHPDLVVFSPRGDAAVLYSQSGSLQVLSSLPSRPTLSHEVAVTFGVPSNIAVSDDGAVVVAGLSDGSALVSLKGGEWRPLPAAFKAQAWTFIPKTHDLVISDVAQKSLVLLPNVEESSSAVRVIAPNVQLDRLAVTKDGEQLVGVGPSGQLWTLELKSGTLTAREEIASGALLELRDGFSFVLATSPAVSLLKLGSASSLNVASADIQSPAGNR